MKIEKLKITTVLDVEKGTSKAGKEWKKITFVGQTDEQYNNIYAFELFGEDKVDNFLKYNDVGDVVTVEFNVSCNEWNGKYFTTLSAWKIERLQSDNTIKQEPLTEVKQDDDLPF